MVLTEDMLKGSYDYEWPPKSSSIAPIKPVPKPIPKPKIDLEQSDTRNVVFMIGSLVLVGILAFLIFRK